MAKGDGKYRWGGGKKVHNISQGDHDKHVLAQKTLGTQDLTAPPSASQAITEANSAADLQYGPQVQAARQQQANVQPFFTDYLARVAGYARAAQAQMAPVLQQAQAYQTGAATQAPPGLDPSSAAGQQATQAAQGRGALAQLGNDALNTNAQATQDYFGGQQAVAAKELPQAQAVAAQGLANAQTQRGNAVNTFLTGARQNAQNYAIAQGTLGLNNAKAAADTDLARGVDPVTHKPLPAKPETTKSSGAFAGMTDSQINALSDSARQKKIDAYNATKGSDAGAKINKYGIPNDQFAHWSTRHRQRVIDAFAEKGASGATDKAAAKHATDVHQATGKVENQVSDIIGKWASYANQETDDTTKPQDPKTKQYPGRKLTPDEKKRLLAKDYTPQMVHIALLRNANPPKSLDKASIDYLHNLDPNFRIPREWLPSGYGKGGRAPGDTGPPSGRDIGGTK